MENIAIKIEHEQDYSSEEETFTDLVDTQVIELNDFESKDNDYLLVGIFGNGSGYLKAALFDEIKGNHKSFKVKFMSRLKTSNQGKSIIAEVYQFKFKENYHLVLHSKENLNQQSFKFIFDWLNERLSFKRIVSLESVHCSKFVSNENNVSPMVYCLKNRIQLSSNQLIAAPNYPSPNAIQELSAYLLVIGELKNIPCVVYVLLTDVYEVCLETVKLFDKVSVSYEFFKTKLSQENISRIGKNILNIQFREFNTYQNLIYS